MSEKEKMLSQQLYDASDATLLSERVKAKTLCHEYNALAYKNDERQQSIRHELLGEQGKDCYLEAPFYCDYGYNIKMGNNFYVNHNCVMLDCASITFGNHVFVGPNVGFYTASHPQDKEVRRSGLESAASIQVGNDVWIGGNVSVMAGVSIGDNVIIGAGSVVTKDIPSNVVAVGNPCKVLKPLD